MKILVLGDVHLPFTNWSCVQACATFAKSYKPDLIIQVGDITDQYNWSLYKREPDGPNATLEFEMMIESFKRFHSYFKSYDIKILFGNHDKRKMLRAFEVNIPKAMIKTLDELFPYENIIWHTSVEPFVADNTIFIHGDEMMGNAWQKAQRLGHSLVQGHDHLGYLNYINTFKKQIFGMSAGCMIDAQSIAARYAAKNPMRCWLGWATVTDGIPHLYPFGGKNA